MGGAGKGSVRPLVASGHFPLQGPITQSLLLILRPQEGGETQAGTECSLRLPHPEMLSCLGDICQGILLHKNLFRVWLSPTVKGGLWVGLDASMCESSSGKMRMGS